jgi:nucleoside-diphosphate-sugar epimerase
VARVLVTGASGFIGGHLVEYLLSAGDEVRVLMRDVRRGGWVDQRHVEVFMGDIRDVAAVENAVAGVEIVYHLAGSVLAFSEKGFNAVNRVGTVNVATACARHLSPPVVVGVSSLAAAGPSLPGRPRIESDPSAPISAYGRSKLAGEHALRSVARRVPVTIVRPPGVIGPRELNLLSVFQMVSKGWYVTIGSGDLELSIVEVRDLAVALREAAVQGRRLSAEPDESETGVYFVAQHEHATLTELANLIARALDRPAPHTVRLPPAAAWGLVAAVEAAARVRRRPGFLNFDKLCEARARAWTCSSERAGRELGFRPRNDLAEVLRQMAQWYDEHGWLRRNAWTASAGKRRVARGPSAKGERA